MLKWLKNGVMEIIKNVLVHGFLIATTKAFIVHWIEYYIIQMNQ